MISRIPEFKISKLDYPTWITSILLILSKLVANSPNNYTLFLVGTYLSSR